MDQFSKDWNTALRSQKTLSFQYGILKCSKVRTLFCEPQNYDEIYFFSKFLTRWFWQNRSHFRECSAYYTQEDDT